MKTKRQLTIEEQQERNRKIILAIVFIAFFIFMFATTKGQVKRVSGYNWIYKKDLTTLSPNEPLKFGASQSDTLIKRLTIKSDSLNSKLFSVFLSVQYPKSETLPLICNPLRIDFDNGETGYFVQIRKYKDNVVDYQVVPETFALLLKCKADYVEFQNSRAYLSDKEYFSNFLKFLNIP